LERQYAAELHAVRSRLNTEGTLQSLRSSAAGPRIDRCTALIDSSLAPERLSEARWAAVCDLSDLRPKGEHNDLISRLIGFAAYRSAVVAESRRMRQALGVAKDDSAIHVGCAPL
jgi:hypothetical protein